ncbi:GNAT family N-acetyltransferase [Priestia flexa]|uniref:GNAT family N-acetyltransferase n=1 Tax=Priestia flexa TaxID=86664 RepID=UPI0039B4C7E1
MNIPTLDTKRLTLRESKESDAVHMLRYLSDPVVMKHMGLEPFQTIDDVKSELSWYRNIVNEGTGMRWGITLKEEGVIIGSCGFLDYESSHERASVGYELHQEYWRQGIAAEAMKAVIEYGFSNWKLHRIQALIEPENISSQKLAEKLGFHQEGLLREYEHTCGKFDDLYMYSLLKREWKERRAD